MKKVQRSKFRLQEHEAAISHHLPYAYLAEKDMVCTKQGDYLAILKIEGIPINTLEDAEINFHQNLRSKLLAHFCDPRFAIYHTIIRNKLSILTSDPLNEAELVHRLIDDYHQKLIQNDLLFSNDLYLTILLKGSGSRGNRVTSRLNQWFHGLSHQMDKKRQQSIDENSINQLNEAVLKFVAALESYRVRRLSLIPGKHGSLIAEQLNFFGRILNYDDAPYLVKTTELDHYLPRRQLFFGGSNIEVRGNTESLTHFAAMISLKEYPATTYPGILDEILSLPIEMVITQSYIFQNRQETRENLELQLRRLKQARDPDKKGIGLLEQALGDLVGGEFGFGYHHFTIMVLAKNLSALEVNVAELTKHCNENGIIAIREGLNTEAAFWAQFPGNFRYIARKLPITTANFAAFCSLHNEPRGQKINNHWGEAITILKTPQHQPYYFNFHPINSDVGHTLVIGPTGSGKTLLTCFLIANALKYSTRVFYFDKDHGAEAFMRGIGADCITLGHGQMAGFNPLQLPDTPSNRQFLKEWVGSLLSIFNEPLSSADTEVIHQAIRLNYQQLKPEERTLANLAPAFGTSGPGTLRERFDNWHSLGAYAEFFGSEKDHLKLDNRFFCFEMGALLDSTYERIRPSILLYIFYRIQLSLEENAHHAPTIICLDEAWALLDNPIFSLKIKNWLKTFRKRNAMLILLSQELTDISHSTISNTLVAETSTKIFFPDANPQKDIYQNQFHLSSREIDLLQAYSGMTPRYFLIKQSAESTFATLDHMNNWLSILSGNSETIYRLRQLIKQYGSSPNQWLEHYLKEGNT